MIGVVTVLYNSDEVLPGFFESLARQTNVSYRLYLIDNSPTDSGTQISMDLAAKYNIDSRFIFNDENVGVAKGNNQGIELALVDGCKSILLANNDIEFYDESLFSDLLETLRIEKVHAVVPKIYFFTDKKRIWCAGGFFRKFAVTNPHIGYGQVDVGQFEKSELMEYSPTCFMIFNAQVFKMIGNMDERYFVYCDDSDFLWRMKKENLRLFYFSEKEVWHKVSFSTGGVESNFSLYYCFRNRVFFAKKHYGLVLRMLFYFYLSLTLCIKFFKFNSEQRKFIKKGIVDGFVMQVRRD
ncbi:glycosyltransferase family 2 protein [Robbsia andropogonis]|uniref:glycosyltransferase family 2 protein n=1 Tax=Robbsia andropogonis TaxID=28092 RepID=UPI00209F8925|nr:glycosyltransferase family 2 protein [Robbsia andropogonis]MCP1121496.1 glycosyltransferase family 2 protein [Robbsia andropogonis]MCP1131314.1 glycosyltransferase family 2 protein [Robbsia andropogonis]